MRDPLIIGLTGHIGVGKDTFANLLVRGLGPAGVVLPIAAPVKRTVQVAFDLEPIWLTDEYKNVVHPEYGITPRDMCRTVGTDLFVRTFGKEFWLRHVANFIKRSSFELLVLPDVRNNDGTDYEATWLHTLPNFKLVRLIGPYRRDPGRPGHQSDVPVLEQFIDYEINNSGDIDQLACAAALLLQDLRG